MKNINGINMNKIMPYLWFTIKCCRDIQSFYNMKRTCHVSTQIYINVLMIPSAGVAGVDLWHLTENILCYFLHLLWIVGSRLSHVEIAYRYISECEQYFDNMFSTFLRKDSKLNRFLTRTSKNICRLNALNSNTVHIAIKFFGKSTILIESIIQIDTLGTKIFLSQFHYNYFTVNIYFETDIFSTICINSESSTVL